MKVLLFGGSFDPPHSGHAALLRAALKALSPERTFLLPAWRSPLKAGHAAPPADRLRMAELLSAECGGASSGVHVDPFELRRGTTTYTYEALRRFRTKFPLAELWFLAGSDAAATVGKWKRSAEVRSGCRWILGRRPGYEAPAGLASRVLRGSFPRVSSSLLRARLIAGMDAAGSIPTTVASYIARKGLYGAEIHRELRSVLAPGRYAHTLSVARLAVELAQRHGLDAEKAALAGLLHDAGRRFDPAGVARYIRDRRLSIPHGASLLAANPMLAHAFVSEDLARRRYGIADRDVLAAIRHHTFGALDMPPLARLLYVADSASGDRDFPEAARMRSVARNDLDRAFLEAVRLKLGCVIADGLWLHPDTALLWNRALEQA